MTPKFAIVVPYRDRETHLRQFIPYLNTYFNANPEFPRPVIYIVEQVDDRPFNRAALINIGIIQAEQDGLSYSVAHDVDHLPINVDYSLRSGITQLATNEIQTTGFVGAATMFDFDTFYRIGGYNADYFSRGEDNELYFHLKRLHIEITFRTGSFKKLPHPRPWKEFDRDLWQKAQRLRSRNYATLKYNYTVEPNDEYIHIKANLKR